MALKNYMEDVVSAVYDDYVNNHREICQCQQCRMDTMAIALTKLRGMYAATPEGEVLTRIQRDDRQVRADALMVVLEAIRIVSARPQH